MDGPVLALVTVCKPALACPCFCGPHPLPTPLLRNDSRCPGAAIASQQGPVIATWPGFVISLFLLRISLCFRSPRDKCRLSWPPLKKMGCFKRDSGASEHTLPSRLVPKILLALASAKCEFKLDLEFLRGILGVDKMTGYFCAVLTQEHLSVHPNRPCI